MKTIFNLLIISIIAISLTSYVQKSSDNIKIVILRTSDKKANPELLNQSAGVISARLISYGLNPTDVKIATSKNEIEVQLSDNINLTDIEGLLTSSGELDFYETMTLNGIGDLKKDDPFFSPTDARIGCADFEDPEMVKKAEDYLKSENLQSSSRLFWGLKNDKSQYCLYVLKVSKEGKALMTRSDIEVIKCDPEKDSESLKIGIKFKKEASGRWEKATGDNINKPIAIVVGSRVFYTPVVRDAIVSGLCEVTGNMTQKEVSYFLALVTNEPLPLSFKIIR